MDEETRLKEHLTNKPTSTSLNILVLGAPSSGKRSVCSRLADIVFPLDRDPTENGEYRRLIQLFPPEQGRPPCRVMLNWTTILADAAQMNPSFLQHMVPAHDAFLLVYRTTDRATFEAVEDLWRDHVAGKGEGAAFVVANGGDGDGDDMISKSEGLSMANGIGAAFWQLDAKTGHGAAEEEVVAMAKAMLLHSLRGRE